MTKLSGYVRMHVVLNTVLLKVVGITKPIETEEKCLVVFGFILLSIIDRDGDKSGHRVSFVVLWKTCTRKMLEKFWYARRECGDRMFNFPEENCSSSLAIPGC